MLDTFAPTSSSTHARESDADLKSAAPQAIAFCAANSWVRAARHCRFNIDPLFSSAGVEVDSAGVPQIRRGALVKLMQQCVLQAAPQSHFPLVMGDLFAFDHLPVLETFLATSPSLRQALPALKWVGKALTNVSMRVEEGPELSALIIEVDMLADNPRVKGYFTEAILAGIHKFVRLAIGDSAEVLHAEISHDPGPQRLACEAQFKIPVRINQARNAVVFRTALLEQPLPGSVPGMHQRAHQLIEQQLPAQ